MTWVCLVPLLPHWVPALARSGKRGVVCIFSGGSASRQVFPGPQSSPPTSLLSRHLSLSSLTAPVARVVFLKSKPDRVTPLLQISPCFPLLKALHSTFKTLLRSSPAPSPATTNLREFLEGSMLLPGTPAASCQLTPIFLPPGGPRLGIREGSQVPQHGGFYQECLSAPLCLSQGAELLKGSSVSFMATVRCQAQASLGINSQELLVKLDYMETSLKSQISLVPYLLPSPSPLPS